MQLATIVTTATLTISLDLDAYLTLPREMTQLGRPESYAIPA